MTARGIKKDQHKNIYTDIKRGFLMKAMVLCSGGVDSTTCLGIAVDKYGARKCCGTVNILWTKAHKGN